MNWDQVKGNWTQLKGKAREQWADLTDDDLEKIGGMKDQFVGKLQEKYGQTREDAEKAAEDWAKSLQEQGEQERTRRAS